MTPGSFFSEESILLRQLIEDLGLPLRRLPEIIEEKPEVCLSWWSRQNQDIKIKSEHFERMANVTGISESSLLSGVYDRDLARKRIFGDYASLPERYSENQNSFLRTSSHIIRYITLTRGQHFADQVMTNMNLSPLIYKMPDTKINLTYFADLLETLSKMGLRQSEMDNLSAVLFLSLQDTALGIKFQAAQNLHEVYEVLASNFGYFDTNFDYTNKFVKNKYILKTVLPLENHKGLKINSGNLERLMRYRHILLAWFPYLAGMTPHFPKTEVVRSSSSILETTYEVNLGSGPKPLSTLRAL